MSKLNEQQLHNLLLKDELPAIKLSKEELDLLNGGTWPLIQRQLAKALEKVKYLASEAECYKIEAREALKSIGL